MKTGHKKSIPHCTFSSPPFSSPPFSSPPFSSPSYKCTFTTDSRSGESQKGNGFSLPIILPITPPLPLTKTSTACFSYGIKRLQWASLRLLGITENKKLSKSLYMPTMKTYKWRL
nr:hypothetical protein BSM_05090 [uncultured archaeon]CBH37666.1 hypothetical protein BSM_11430 [uncultured archaeon]CBH39983.1 hypothetical protein BSM_34620 [uncultured archaeon]